LGGQIKQITASRNPDGHLEVFAIGSDNSLWHIWQKGANNIEWTEWVPLGGFVKQITVAPNADGHLEVFAIGGDDALWHTWQDGSSDNGWSDWSSMGGNDLRQIAVASNKDGRLEVFTRDTSNGLKHIWQDRSSATAWSGWNYIGSPFLTLSVARGLSGELHLFSINAFFNDLWEAFQSPNGDWNPIQPISDGNSYQGVLGVETKDDIELILFDTDDKFNQRQPTPQLGSWSPRSEIALPSSLPNDDVLPPGGMRGLISESTLSNVSDLISSTPSTTEDRIERLKLYRAICLGVALGSVMSGNAAGAAVGIGCAIKVEEALEKQEDKLGKSESPSTSNTDPTPNAEERQRGGFDREPREIRGVDSSPASREDVGHIC
jgi:hypothetical protein